MSRLARIAAASTLAFLLATLAGLALPSRGAAEPLETIFVDANRAYFAGDFAGAARSYERLVAAGVADPDVFYNLGLARARANEYGAAIVAFEKTLALRPGDDDAEDALGKVREALAQRRAEREGEATTDDGGGLLVALGSIMPEPALAILVLALNVLAFGSLAGLLRARSEAMRVALGVTAPIAFTLLVLGGLALLGRTEALVEGKAAIVVDDHAAVREGPDPNASHAAELREGDRVRVLTRHETYYEVVSADRTRGWVDADAIGLLDAYAAAE